MASVNATINDSDLIITIPAEYLSNAFEMGVTTNVTGNVTDEQEMLKHFARQIESGDNDSHFGRFIDAVCEEALEGGEPFVDCDDYADNDCC
ncbi:hypothetical protein JQC92_02580 [Shewanella sp. 202IG2-18]|uniref:hypothetical protein n=1 Tax=Parashewanella hymeniacidonis TaxID=2807618 RepID=UPI00195F7D83|nr:hypothetical protein [Parashewanella hymeniacidonis]MBM7070928.1 hypothetical protein [Parashewanella hymeniacidonis]